MPQFKMEFDFTDMSPYTDKDVSEVLGRISSDPLFSVVTNYLWPEVSLGIQKDKAKKIRTVAEFQKEFMHSAIRTITSRSSDGLTYSGIENLNPQKPYLFVANHRDILLDSAILQTVLVENHFPTTEITFGNNLMKEGFITDLGKLNRMFTVRREGTGRELYKISQRLSAYIRHCLCEKGTSIWIAQKAGRTKDGFDLTQTGLLKMLSISGEGGFESKMSELNIVPLTISYEYEPCDSLKVQETYLSSLHANYVKSPNEDVESIITGVTQKKGRIHLAFGGVIEKEDLKQDSNIENDKVKFLANLIDEQIYANFKLWPIHFIAFDLLFKSDSFVKHYSIEQKKSFQDYVENGVAGLIGEYDALRSIFLSIYANPVINQLKLG